MDDLNLDKVGKKPASNIPLFFGLFGILILLIGLIGIWYFTSYSYTFSKFYDDSPDIRRWAVDSMVQKGEKVGERMLAVAKNSNENPEVRRLAIFVLGEIKYQPALPDLKALFHKSSLPLREQAAYALGRFAREEIALEMIPLYWSSPKGLKLKIIISLGDIGGDDAEALLKKVMEDNDELLSKAAEIALAKAKSRMSI